MIYKLDQEIQESEQQLKIKNAEYKNIDAYKQQIFQLDGEVARFKQKINTYPQIPNKMVLLEQIAQLNNLYIEEFTVDEPIEKKQNESEMIWFYEIPIQFEFLGKYKDIQKFIQHIGKSQKLFYLKKMELKSQEAKNQKQVCSEEWLNVIFDGVTYCLKKEDIVDINDSQHYNFMQYEYGNTDPFGYALTKNIGTEVLEQVEDERVQQLPQTSGNPIAQKNVTEFKICINDVLTSGDNYYIVGPQKSNVDSMIKTRSSRSADFHLEVSPRGYLYTLQAQGQNKKLHEENMFIQNSCLNIESNMYQLTDSNFQICVYIENKTNELMKVVLNGNYLNRILIFDTNGREIQPGQTKANIMVVYR